MPFTRTTMGTFLPCQSDDLRFGLGADLVLADTGRRLNQAQPLSGDVQHAEIGDDALHDPRPV